MFPHVAAYRYQHVTDNAGLNLLTRAINFINGPQSLVLLRDHCSEDWILFFDLILTRPTASQGPVDTSVNTCAQRSVDRHCDAPETRFVRVLYPRLVHDSACLTEYLLQEPRAISLYGQSTLDDTYATQKATLAGCLVSELQDVHAAANIDHYLSQSDLLFYHFSWRGPSAIRRHSSEFRV